MSDQAYIDGRLVMDSKQELADAVVRLRAQLLDQRCPSDTRGTVRECIEGKQCGCTNGLVLDAHTGKGRE